MKIKKLDLICTIVFLIVNISLCLSQTPVLTISPISENNAVCPNINVTYTISNYNAACHSISTVNGTLIQDNDDGTLIMNWLDNGAKGSITVTRNSSGCSGIAGTRTFDVPIKTLAQATPTITGPSGPAAGFQHVVTYTAQLNWPFRGNNDPNPFTVNTFDWALPVGWTNNTTPATSATINVSTNIGGGGTVTATGRTDCGSGSLNSLPGLRTINRTLSVPCPMNAQRLTERCGEPGTNAFFASSQPAGYSANNPQWSWSIPQGWTATGPTNSQFLTVNTDGQHGGNVEATFSDWGVSAKCTLPINLVVANPGTFADGSDRLCETQTYSLTNLPLATGASSTWAISPSNASITPLSGTGTSATITPLDASPGSTATIIFTVSGCGLTNTFPKTIFVGRPEIYDHRINGVPGASKNVCPGWQLLGAQVRGDDSSPPCLTWELVNNQGSPPHTLHDMFCSWASLYMNPLNNAPAFVKVTADNECGPTSSYFYLYPTLQHCKENYSFIIYPNPASSILHLEVLFDDGQNEAFAITISHAQLVNMMGVTALDLPNIESQAVELDLSLVPNGLYVARVLVGNQWLTEMVQVSKS